MILNDLKDDCICRKNYVLHPSKNFTCVLCTDASVHGLRPAGDGTCICNDPATWDSETKQCKCPLPKQVFILIGGKFTCSCNTYKNMVLNSDKS
jgi:hypothetical protein